MLGVTYYGGPCPVCALPQDEQEAITVAILAGARSYRLKRDYPDLRLRDFRQHRRQCLKKGG